MLDIAHPSPLCAVARLSNLIDRCPEATNARMITRFGVRTIPIPAWALMHRCLRGTNLRRWHGYLHKSGRHVIDETGDEPLSRQCGNRSEQGDVDSDRRTRIVDRFFPEFPALCLKIVRQHGGLACETSDAAIGVVEYNEVKF